MTDATDGVPPPPEPAGPDARAALVAAAVHEMGVRGVEGASVRAIAARAGVNHGLVHRHFGSKEGLLGAVLDQLAGDIASAFDRDGLSALSSPAVAHYGRVVARAILDGYDVPALQQTHPVMERILPVAIALANRPEAEVRVLVARQMALLLGWLLFEPFVVASVGLDAEQLAWAKDTQAPFWDMFADLDETPGAAPA